VNVINEQESKYQDVNLMNVIQLYINESNQINGKMNLKYYLQNIHYLIIFVFLIEPVIELI
jgi:hypothetical protein